MTMQISVIQATALNSTLHAEWARIQQADATYDNPYFRPEFTQAVASVRPDVEVAVLEDAGRVVGFFPFQRAARRIGKPVGGRLSDFQAVIVQGDVSVDPRELVRGCGLAAWDFDHLLVSQQEFSRFHYATDGSPYIDVSQGYKAYCDVRKELGDEELKQTQRKTRKLTRDVGPLRLVMNSDDPQSLELLLQWKSDQYRRTQITDVFAFGWTSELVRRLAEFRHPDFSGYLTVLFAGDVPAAMHFGLWSQGVLHYWFPAYDPGLSHFSPGRVMLLEMARLCGETGLRRIDLGRGMAPYKTRMMTGVTQVAVGSVDLRPVTNALRCKWRQAQDWVRNSPWRKHARIPGRMLYRVREWLEFR
jgi:CelD/BcsL family acetyltransferase involved in cellulose biosynthesis